jgi:hypothetical protein
VAYARNTKVSVEKSRQDVERVLARYGGRMLATFMPDEGVVLVFEVNVGKAKRMVRFTVPVPRREQVQGRGRIAAEERFERAVKQRWRVLILLLKAKFEAVGAGVKTFDEEFLADVVTHSGQTVGDMTLPKLRDAYAKEGMPMQALPSPAPAPLLLTAGQEG